jgi:hypothetical protein
MSGNNELPGKTKRVNCFSFLRGIFLIVTIALVFPFSAMCSSDSFVDSDDYKDKGFAKCIITDYSDLVKGDDVDWVWVSPSQQLSHYTVKLGTTENKSEHRSKSLVDKMKATFKDSFADQEAKESKGTLTANLCIYEVQDFNPGKAWIPFVGGHQMQAGVGVEMVLADQNGKTVAKFRHFARRGSMTEAAVEEVAEDLTKYVSKH